jgi:hypothetical protein
LDCHSSIGRKFSYSAEPFFVSGGEMSEHLSEFLIDMASDPSRAASFAANPQFELDRSQLSAEERDAILGGDAARIRFVLKGEGGGGVMTTKKKSGTKKKPAPKKKTGKKK